MSGQWWESNLIVGPFSNITGANAWAAANPSSLFLGLLATINGVPYSWNGTGWGAVGGGGGLPVFASYAALPAPTLGLLAQIPRLCGNGYFALRANGTRWEVCPGESIIRDAGPASAGYDLTATGTAYVALASYTIPAGLIGDGEEWEGDFLAKSNATWVSGNAILKIRLSGNIIGASQPALSAANSVSRARGAIVRLGGIVASRVGNANTDLFTSVLNGDFSLNLSTDQTIDAGFDQGAIGNTMCLRQWVFRRIG